MIEQSLLDRAWDISLEYRKITPAFMVRKLKINFDTAHVVCQKIWLRRNREAKEETKRFLESLVCDSVCECLDRGI